LLDADPGLRCACPGLLSDLPTGERPLLVSSIAGRRSRWTNVSKQLEWESAESPATLGRPDLGNPALILKLPDCPCNVGQRAYNSLKSVFKMETPVEPYFCAGPAPDLECFPRAGCGVGAAPFFHSGHAELRWGQRGLWHYRQESSGAPRLRARRAIPAHADSRAGLSGLHGGGLCNLRNQELHRGAVCAGRCGPGNVPSDRGFCVRLWGAPNRPFRFMDRMPLSVYRELCGYPDVGVPVYLLRCAWALCSGTADQRNQP
jgi:hypothetical protein